MNIFGFKITLCKKDDRRLSIELKKIVVSLDNYCKSLIKDLDDGIELDAREISRLISNISDLDALLRVYMDNKFSLPSQVYQSRNLFDELQNYTEKLLMKIEEFASMMQQTDSNKDYQCDMEKTDMFSSQTKLLVDIRSLTNHMIVILWDIRILIHYDYIRISLGTDIIDDYYHRKKTIKLNKNDIACEFNIKIHKSIHEYIRKRRNVKNEHG